ncbi:hypothetical protein FRB95_012861 [Tulasnella sp. JGI-2019a]|nr:hypothetical protein FRB95_012861 [Tulasnella sp. JGI-2019a]
MPVIPGLTDLQEGTLWGQFIETLLFGIYTCLLIVTLWRPIVKMKRLTIIGWIVVAIYFLTLGRFAADFRALYRTLFVTCGDPAKFQPADYVLRGFQDGLTFIACVASDSLFCWRLYVIWSRNIRIILLPVFLMVLYTIDCTLIVITNFCLMHRPNDPKFETIYARLWMVSLGIAILNTVYVTSFIISRLWRVGNATNKFASPQDAKKNHYQGVINALVQSGATHSTAIILYIVALSSKSIVFQVAVQNVTSDANSIASTLLFLQLELFQQEAQRTGAAGQALTTGATIKFATPRRTETGWSSAPATRLRRTSMPTYLNRDSTEDVTHLPTPSPLLNQHKAEYLSLSDRSGATSRLDDGDLREKKESIETTI